MKYDYPTVEVIELASDLHVRIVADEDPISPKEWDNVGEIAYLSRSRYCLGTEEVSEERMNEIAAGVEDGSLLGLAVYAYVHSGASIRCAPFSCPWDSGQSGFVYCERERGIKECGSAEAALKCLESEVGAFDQYLRGDVYGYVVERLNEDGEAVDHLDSCWGFYGIEYAREEAREAGEYWLEKMRERQAQRERDLDAHYAGM